MAENRVKQGKVKYKFWKTDTKLKRWILLNHLITYPSQPYMEIRDWKYSKSTSLSGQPNYCRNQLLWPKSRTVMIMQEHCISSRYRVCLLLELGLMRHLMYTLFLSLVFSQTKELLRRNRFIFHFVAQVSQIDSSSVVTSIPTDGYRL